MTSPKHLANNYSPLHNNWNPYFYLSQQSTMLQLYILGRISAVLLFGTIGMFVIAGILMLVIYFGNRREKRPL
jgi:uncharacterized membrane protein